MKSEVFFFLKIVFVYLGLCTVGLFFALIISMFILSLVNGSEVDLSWLIFWAAKKSCVGGVISAAWVVFFIYANRFFDRE